MKSLRAWTWKPASAWRAVRPPAALRGWLLEQGSLTRRLSRACGGRLRVRLLVHGWDLPWPDERRVLDLRIGERCLVREVRLECDGEPWVYARSLIPATTLRGRNRRLGKLGERPLGAVLFADPTLERGAMQTTRLPPQDPRLAPSGAREALWGRRSLFRVHGEPVLVSEFFWPRVGGCG